MSYNEAIVCEVVCNRDERCRDVIAKGMKEVTVYVVAQLLITDATFYDRYRAQFNVVVSRYTGTVLAADDTPPVVEGNWKQRNVVLMSFPDEESFLKWWESPEYRTIAKDRRGGSDAVIWMVKGRGKFRWPTLA